MGHLEGLYQMWHWRWGGGGGHTKYKHLKANLENLHCIVGTELDYVLNRCYQQIIFTKKVCFQIEGKEYI